MVREKLFLESKEGKGLSEIGSNASLKVKRFHSEVKNHLLSNSPLVFALLSCHHVSSFSYVLQCCKHPASAVGQPPSKFFKCLFPSIDILECFNSTAL